MLTQADIDFFRTLKGVGLARAKELFTLAEVWDDVSESASKPTLSKSKLRLVKDVGNIFSSKVSQKRGGAPINPNSNFQRILREVKAIVDKEGYFRTSAHIKQVAAKLGMSEHTVRINSTDVRNRLGLSKVSHGLWKKAA